jgi:outer membrane protein W
MPASRAIRALAAVAVILAAARPAPAGDLKLRLFAAFVEPTGGSTLVSAEPGEVAVNLESAGGGGLALEYMIAPRWGLELGALFAQPGVSVSVSAVPPSVRVTQGLGITPVSLGTNYYAVPEGRARLYLGVQVARVGYRSLEVRIGTTGVAEEISFDSDFGFGGQVGLEVPFGASRWMFNATARYLMTTATPHGSDSGATVDPFIVTLGIAVRLG